MSNETQASHTPGPWAHRKMRHHFAIETASRTRVADVGFIVRPDGSTSEDDARLIAAAPELLDALHQVEDALGCNLQWLYDSLEPLWRIGSEDNRRDALERLTALQDAWKATCAAIAKATGGNRD